MEAELGEMDAEGRSERPPYAPGKEQRRAKLRTGEATLWQAWWAWATPVCTGRVSWLKCWILL